MMNLAVKGLKGIAINYNIIGLIFFSTTQIVCQVLIKSLNMISVRGFYDFCLYLNHLEGAG